MNSSLASILVADGTTTIALNRPEKRNALNCALLEELCAAVSAADAAAGQRVLFLEGAGPVFCAGLDLAEAADRGRDERSAALLARLFRLFRDTRLVTIAVAQGAAIAGGAGLLTLCDFSVVTSDIRIGFPEVRRGLVAALVMAPLRRKVSDRDARELLLGGELIDAARAREIGLVNRISPDLVAARAEAHAFAQSVLQGAPAAVAATKQLLREIADGHPDRAHAAHLAARSSPEAAEGLAAFREQRPPRWPVRH